MFWVFEEFHTVRWSIEEKGPSCDQQCFVVFQLGSKQRLLVASLFCFLCQFLSTDLIQCDMKIPSEFKLEVAVTSRLIII